MKVEITYAVTMSETQATSLKKVLGGLTTDEFSALGVRGGEREDMSVLYDLLPFEDEEPDAN